MLPPRHASFLFFLDHRDIFSVTILFPGLHMLFCLGFINIDLDVHRPDTIVLGLDDEAFHSSPHVSSA